MYTYIYILSHYIMIGYGSLFKACLLLLYWFSYYSSMHIINRVTMQLDWVQNFFVSLFFRMSVYSEIIGNSSARWWYIYIIILYSRYYFSTHLMFLAQAELYMTSATFVIFVCNSKDQSMHNRRRLLINDDMLWYSMWNGYCCSQC